MISPEPTRAPHSTAVIRYAAAVVVLVGAVTSQYVVPGLLPASRPVYGTLVGDVAVVYVLPVAAFALLVGAGPLRGWSADLGRASAHGLAWYGAMSLFAVLLTAVLAVVYAVADPSALGLLDRPNPALVAAAGDPWFFVGFSFVIGAFEETLFRGWVFGFWLGRSPDWVTPALLSSALFAAVHLYYGTTYGIAAPLIFPTLFLLGFAFAATYRTARGNLVVPAVLHGATDAAAYLTLVSLTAGNVFHWTLIFVGGAVGLVIWGRTSGEGRTAAPPPSADRVNSGGP